MGNGLCKFGLISKNAKDEMVQKLLRNSDFVNSLKKARESIASDSDINASSSVSMILGSHMKDSGVDLETIQLGEKIKVMHEDRIRKIDLALLALKEKDPNNVNAKALLKQKTYSQLVIRNTMKNLMNLAHIRNVEMTTDLQQKFLQGVAKESKKLDSKSENILLVNEMNDDLKEIMDTYEEDTNFLTNDDYDADSLSVAAVVSHPSVPTNILTSNIENDQGLTLPDSDEPEAIMLM